MQSFDRLDFLRGDRPSRARFAFRLTAFDLCVFYWLLITLPRPVRQASRVARWRCVGALCALRARALADARLQDASIEAKVGDIEKRLQRERKMLEASKQMKAATTNVDVQSSLVAKIEQSERTISYFEESLRDLLSRASPGSSATNSSTNLSSLAMTSTLDSRDQRSSAGTSSSSGGLYSSRALPAVPGQLDGSESTGLTPTASSASLAQPRQYSNLGELERRSIADPQTSPRTTRL